MKAIEFPENSVILSPFVIAARVVALLPCTTTRKRCCCPEGRSYVSLRRFYIGMELDEEEEEKSSADDATESGPSARSR